MQHTVMGDLPGHVVIGVALAFWGTLWLARSVRWRAGEPSPALATPLESWLKILYPIGHIPFEARWLTWPLDDGSRSVLGHIICVGAVLVSGIVDKLVARGVLPAGADRAALAAAFAVIVLVFTNHGHHLVVASTVHALFAWTLAGACIVVVAEHWVRSGLMAWLRAYSVVLAGVWLVHIGWILYLAGYDPMDPQIAVRTRWFFAADAVGLAGITALVYRLGRRRPTTFPASP